MSEILTWAFIVLCGGFLFGMTFYVFYLGLKPEKKIHQEIPKNKITGSEPKVKLS